MHSYSLLSLATFAVPALAQIPPASFNFPSVSTQVGVAFQGGDIVLTPGARYGVDVPVDPSAGMSSRPPGDSDDQNYILLMFDPDAPTPSNPSRSPILHWLGAGFSLEEGEDSDPFPYVLESDDEPFVPYARPMPPPYSAPHRYLFYAFRQPDDFQIPEAYQGFSAENRTQFPVTDFLSDAGLDGPIAANYLYASNSSFTPPNYSATPTPGAGATPTPTGDSSPSSTQAGASPSYTGAASHVGFSPVFAVVAGVGALFFGM